MKKILFFTNLLIICSLFTSAQNKILTIQDASWMNPELRPEYIQNLTWKGNSNLYTFVENDTLLQGNTNNEKTTPLVSLTDLNVKLADQDLEELNRFPNIKWLDTDRMMFRAHNKLFIYFLNDEVLNVVNEYPENAQNIDVDENTFKVAYTIDNNLLMSDNGKEITITKDSDEGIINGQTVHRVEFGINTGTFWSPKGNYLAFYRKDETMVTDYPLVDIDKRIAETKNIKYPMAGMTSEEVKVGVFDTKKNTVIYLKTGEPADQYLTGITWSPDEQFVFVGVLNRGQNHLKLNKYDATSGDFIETLFEEKDPRYVEPEHGLYFLNKKRDQFLWFSEKDGYNHLYLYDINGNEIKQVTTGEWVVTRLLGVDDDDKKVYYISTEESPIEKHIYSIDLESGKKTKITHAKGTHNGTVSSDGKFVLANYSCNSEGVVRKYEVIDTKGKIKHTLLESKDPLKDYNMGETSIFTIQNDEGTDLYCRMIKPAGFDPSQKYPVLLYVYGGPHSQLVTDSWLAGAGLFLNYMAQNGYIVFTLDNRGTNYRGAEFEKSIHRNLGTLEVADQMAGIEYLKSLEYVDSDRIGVNGWSYGGFMTISLMLKNPDAFKVGVCGGPVTDWKYYEIMYGERYMDTPEENPEGYETSSLLNKADQLKGKLLIIHGTEDPTVVWQHSLQFIKECIKAEKQLDYFVYPGHGHGVGGKDRVHLNEKMANYFMDNL